MAVFARLFETPSGQVLLTKEFEEDEYRLSLRGEGNSIATPTLSFTYEDEETRDRAFDSITQQHADEQGAEMARVVGSFFGKKEG